MLTAAGEVRVERRYYRCVGCGMTASPWDDWAGLGKGRLSPGAAGLAALAGRCWSFDEASVRLEQFCGLAMSDKTIRQATLGAGRAAGCFLETPAAAAGMTRAGGPDEFYTDGLKVNTRGGWREMRTAIFVRRDRGTPAAPQAWRERVLPEPRARLAVAGLSDSGSFGQAWRGWADRLGVGHGERLSVLADGAAWIWKQAAAVFPAAEAVLDVFHLSEKFHQAGRTLLGEGEAARAWAQERLDRLIGQGAARALADLEAQAQAAGPGAGPGPGPGPGAGEAAAAWGSLLGYVREHRHAMDYAGRLTRGQPIGSGLVEGACKNMLGRRLKLNSARWRPENAEAVAALCCVDYNQQWHECFDDAA